MIKIIIFVDLKKQCYYFYSHNYVRCTGVVFINLVDNKKDQGKLGVAFKETIDSAAVRQKTAPHSLTYVWFDFHHECKQKGKWNNLGLFPKLAS